MTIFVGYASFGGRRGNEMQELECPMLGNEAGIMVAQNAVARPPMAAAVVPTPLFDDVELYLLKEDEEAPWEDLELAAAIRQLQPNPNAAYLTLREARCCIMEARRPPGIPLRYGLVG